MIISFDVTGIELEFFHHVPDTLGNVKNRKNGNF